MLRLACSRQATDRLRKVTRSLRTVALLAVWSAVAAAGPPTDPTACFGVCQMTYHGGTVISNVKLYAVMWSQAVVAEVRDQAGDSFQALANNDYLDWLNEYNTTFSGGSQQAIGRGTYAGRYIINPFATGQSITDSQISSELDAQINAGNLPQPDDNSLYVVFFPPGITVQVGTLTACLQFCAYHQSYIRGGKRVAYAVMPDFSSSDCQRACAGTGLFPKISAVAAHEIVEAITDTRSVDNTLGWVDPANGEMGDVCIGRNDTISSIANGGTYWVQQIFSNKTGKCHTTRTDAQDFKIWFNPNAVSLVAGSSAAVQLPLSSATTSGSSQTLNLSVSGLPAGVTGTFTTNSVTSGNGATLILSAANATAAATDAVVVTMAVGGSTHTAAVLLQVKVAANDFALSASGPVMVARGNAVPVTLSTTRTKGAAESISLSAGSLPSGLSVQGIAPTQVVAGGSASLTLIADAAAPKGSATFSVIGTSPSVERSASVTVNVIASPTASFTAPNDGATLSGSQTISVTGTSDPETTLSQIAVLDNGASLGSCSSVPCSLTWNTQTAANGPHRLEVVATDGTGAQGKGSINVSLQNQGRPQSQVPAAPVGGTAVEASLSCASTSSGEGLAALGLESTVLVIALALRTLRWPSRHSARRSRAPFVTRPRT